MYRKNGTIRLLTVTTLFPNAAQPNSCIFVENRLRHLLSSGMATSRVVAPVPWVPPGMTKHPRYAAFHRAPATEERHGVVLDHPRYLVVPKVGMTLTPIFLLTTLERHIRALLNAGHTFDLIDAHFFYPDGVAAAWLGRRLGLPVTITARGSDLNETPKHPIARRMIQRAAASADGLITVCEALKRRLVELGVPGDKVITLRNGVDLLLFRPPDDREQVRRRWGLRRRTLASVGNLVELKGHDRVIGALPALPDTDLIIAGAGPEEATLRVLTRRLGVEERVRFLGQVAHRELPDLYGAVDALVLASSREGWANVLLEAMACGTTVVATPVGGLPEIVAVPAAGVLTASVSTEGVLDGILRLFAQGIDRRATRRYAEEFDWQATTDGQLALFRSILERRAAPSSLTSAGGGGRLSPTNRSTA